MSDRLFDALETCLQALEKGETIDSALDRFPELASDLHPMLEASLHAQSLAGSPVPESVQRHGRARLLQKASQLRESKRAPRRTWLYNYRPVAIVLMLVLIFVSSTGLVRASSNTIPGDSLYPVKRTWEDVRLVFAFNEETRENLTLEYEGERVSEVDELLVKGRAVPVVFSGFITAQADGQWTVSGVPILITGQTTLPQEPVIVGSAVTVSGATTANGMLQAQSILLVPAGTLVPTPQPENENESNGGESRQEIAPSSSSGNDAGESGENVKSGGTSQWMGTVNSLNGSVWVVDGQAVDVSGAEIVGTPIVGGSVTLEGYVDSSGVFVVTKATFGSNADGDIKLESSSEDNQPSSNSTATPTGESDNEGGGDD